jgi:hypothetical protein
MPGSWDACERISPRGCDPLQHRGCTRLFIFQENIGVHIHESASDARCRNSVIHSLDRRLWKIWCRTELSSSRFQPSHRCPSGRS